MPRVFEIGELVTIGKKGKIVNIVKPCGTYEMYKVQSLKSGEIITAAKHELIKVIPDDEYDFQNLFDNKMETDEMDAPSVKHNKNSPPHQS